MKKFFTLSLAVLLLFAGCSFFKWPTDRSGSKSSAEESTPKESSKPESQVSDKAPEEQTPEEVAGELMESISTLDEDTIRALADVYFAGQSVPDTYYSILKPISERVTYEIGNCTIDGDKATVDMTITSVDAQGAINSILPGAVTHLAAMQITGKDMSNPEQILVEYAAKNINWDNLSTVTTDATLHLVKGSDGEWAVDANNPDNLGFANAISGGGIEVAQSLKDLVERFK